MITNQLHTETANPLWDGDCSQQHGTVVISSYAYNHPREYEQFGELLDGMLA